MRKSQFGLGLCMVLVAQLTASTTRFKGYDFESYAISDVGYRYSEINRNNRMYTQASEGDGYGLVINNPLPVRVAVAVSIDGLNVIDGKRTSPDNAQKWIIEANSSLTLRGWQTSGSTLRRFVFTHTDESYANWKGNRDHAPYTRNLGVIGVAYFWNSAELKAALHPPMPFADRSDMRGMKKSLDAPAAEKSAAPACSRSEQAGTGMGNSESNQVQEVAFHYDCGMYSGRDVLTLYYEFARAAECPRPFIDDNKRDYSPEMP